MLNQYTKDIFDKYGIIFKGESKFKNDIVFAAYPGMTDYENKGFHHDAKLFVLDYQGNVKHYLEVPDKDVSFFIQCASNRYVYTSFARGRDSIVHDSKIVLTDENLNIIKEIYPIDMFCDTENKQYDHETLQNNEHCFKYIDDNHYYIVGNIETTLNTEDESYTIVNDFVQEIDDGQVVWQWESADNFKLLEYSIRHNVIYKENTDAFVDGSEDEEIILYSNLRDCIHINYIDITPKGKLLLSLRNVGLIILNKDHTIEHIVSASDKVDNFKEWEPSYLQHYVKAEDDNTFWCYDNNIDFYNILTTSEEFKKVKPKKSSINIYNTDGSFKKILLNEYGSFRGGNAFKMSNDSNVYTINYGSIDQSLKWVNSNDKKMAYEMYKDLFFNSMLTHPNLWQMPDFIQIEEYDFDKQEQNFSLRFKDDNYVYMVTRGL